jgi:hypothetical protein
MEAHYEYLMLAVHHVEIRAAAKDISDTKLTRVCVCSKTEVLKSSYSNAVVTMLLGNMYNNFRTLDIYKMKRYCIYGNNFPNFPRQL